MFCVKSWKSCKYRHLLANSRNETYRGCFKSKLNAARTKFVELMRLHVHTTLEDNETPKREGTQWRQRSVVDSALNTALAKMCSPTLTMHNATTAGSSSMCIFSLPLNHLFACNRNSNQCVQATVCQIYNQLSTLQHKLLYSLLTSIAGSIL